MLVVLSAKPSRARACGTYATSSIASKSSVMRTSSLTITPPVSRATFHSRPHCLRLIVVLPSNPTTCLPHGDVLNPSTWASRVTGCVTPRIDKSPWTLYVSPPAGTTEVLRKVMCGWFSASKKVGGAQVAVTLLVAGVDARDRNRHVHVAVRGMVAIKDEGALDRTEPSAHSADHEVTDGELDV